MNIQHLPSLDPQIELKENSTPPPQKKKKKVENQDDKIRYIAWKMWFEDIKWNILPTIEWINYSILTKWLGTQFCTGSQVIPWFFFAILPLKMNLTAFEWIAVNFGTDIYCPQMMNFNNFDSLTFCLAPTSAQTVT